MQDLLNAFNFISDHIHLAGWVCIIMLAWKISARVTKFLAGLEETAKKTREAAERSERMEETMNLVASNHLPHLQSGIEEVNETLKDLHRDILTILLSKINKEK